MPIAAVVNQKGGVGKTTTAVNLAAALAQRGKKTLLVDADPQGNSTTGVGIEKPSLNVTLFEVLTEGECAARAIMPTQWENLFILPATLDLAGAEPLLLSQVGRETVLREALEEVLPFYDWVIIDAPPSLGILTINAMASADQVIIPLQCEFYALEGLSQFLKTIELVKKRIRPGLKIGKVVLTMYDARNRLSTQVEQEVRDYFGETVASTTIPRNIKLSEAPGFGGPAVYLYPTCKGSEAYFALAEEILTDA